MTAHPTCRHVDQSATPNCWKRMTPSHNTAAYLQVMRNAETRLPSSHFPQGGNTRVLRATADGCQNSPPQSGQTYSLTGTAPKQNPHSASFDCETVGWKPVSRKSRSAFSTTSRIA